MYSRQKGFTLLEILLVVAAIAILAGIVIFAINPDKQLGDTRDAQRRVDVNTILNAVNQYVIDNDGTLPGAIPQAGTCGASSQEICMTDASSCSGFVDLSFLTNNETYLVSMPVDPQATSSNDGTGYYIKKSSNGRVTVCAPNTEQAETIEATR